MATEPIGIYAEQVAKRAAIVTNLSPAARHAHFPKIYAKPVPAPPSTEIMQSDMDALKRRCAKLEAQCVQLHIRVKELEERVPSQPIELPAVLSACPSAKEIVQLAAAVTGLRIDIMKGASRARPHVYPRHFAIWLVRECRWDMTWTQIAGLFGHRDHSTVGHALKKMETLIHTHPFTGWIGDKRVQDLLESQKAGRGAA